MNFTTQALAALLSVSGLFSMAAQADVGPKLSQKAIYGDDDRRDWHEVSDPKLKGWAEQTAALMRESDLAKSGDRFEYRAPTYEQSAQLCPGSKYGQQLTPGFCSGFLVGPDLLLTAGHCISGLEECKSVVFVFDFAMTRKNQNPKSISAQKVFRCQDVISRDDSSMMDYALIKLDRPVGRPHFTVRRHGKPVRGTKLTMIGHPAGLPSKISDGGEVLAVNDKIIGSVDAFGGNSGSVVINRRTGRAEGILVAGEPDYENAGACMVEKVCGPECQGEQIFPVAAISYLIPD